MEVVISQQVNVAAALGFINLIKNNFLTIVSLERLAMYVWREMWWVEEGPGEGERAGETGQKHLTVYVKWGQKEN